MKTSISNPCSEAAERVKVLFSGSKDHLFFHLLEESTGSSVSKSHAYAPVKLPRIPQGILEQKKEASHKKKNRKENQILPMSPSHRGSKWGAAALHAEQCCANQRDVLLLPEELVVGKGLTPERVKTWRLKEHLLAFQKLKGLRREAAALFRSKKHQVTLIVERNSQADEELKQKESWQELIKLKEERQFQITRITRILTDR